MKRLYYIAFIMLCGVMTVQAGVPGTDGINGATNDVRSFFHPMSDLIMVIGALVGLVGGLRVYTMWNTGDRGVEKAIIGWFGSCIFLELVGVVVRSMFM